MDLYTWTSGRGTDHECENYVLTTLLSGRIPGKYERDQQLLCEFRGGGLLIFNVWVRTRQYKEHDEFTSEGLGPTFINSRNDSRKIDSIFRINSIDRSIY